MREQRRRGWTAFRVLKTAIVAAASLALAVLILQVSASRALPPHLQQQLDLGLEDHTALYQQAARSFIENRGGLDEAEHDRLLATVRSKPLAADPFMFEAFRAMQANEVDRGRRLLEEARRRNPRLRTARLALIGAYLSTGMVEEGSKEIVVASRLVPGAGELLVPDLVRLARSDRSRPALIAAIGSEPLMGLVIQRLLSEGGSVDLALALGARQPRQSDGSFAPWQTLIVNRLLGEGSAARAHAVWRSFVGVGGRAPALIYDPEFGGAPGGPPFNWTFAQDAVGAVERARGGGLEIEYFGRQTGPLASQSLVLAPGSYRTGLRAEGSADAEGSVLEWRITCLRNGTLLLALPLDQLSYTPKDFRRQFSVPASGCEAQKIELRGVAGEFPARQSVRISGLTLQPIGVRS